MARQYGSVVSALQALDKTFRSALEVAVNETAKEQLTLFTGATLKWKNKPKWITRPTPGADRKTSVAYQIVGIADEKTLKIWGWVDLGTEPHFIFPKKPGGVLAFNIGYSAKTSPVANANVGTGKSSGARVFSRGVFHPGTEPRDFAAYFALQGEETLVRKINDAIKRVSRRR